MTNGNKKLFFITMSIDGQEQTESYDSDCFVIGKSKKADFSLSVEGLSRQHLKVSFKNGNIWLEDLGSTFGTIVNKIKLAKGKPYLYTAGDGVKIGVASDLVRIEYRYAKVKVSKDQALDDATYVTSTEKSALDLGELSRQKKGEETDPQRDRTFQIVGSDDSVTPLGGSEEEVPNKVANDSIFDKRIESPPKPSFDGGLPETNSEVDEFDIGGVEVNVSPESALKVSSTEPDVVVGDEVVEDEVVEEAVSNASTPPAPIRENAPPPLSQTVSSQRSKSRRDSGSVAYKVNGNAAVAVNSDDELSVAEDELLCELDDFKAHTDLLVQKREEASELRSKVSALRKSPSDKANHNNRVSRKEANDGYDREHLKDHSYERGVSENQLQLAILKQEIAEIELEELDKVLREKVVDLKSVHVENQIQEKKQFELEHFITQKEVVLKQQKEEIISLDADIVKSNEKLVNEQNRVATEITNLSEQMKKSEEELQDLMGAFEKEQDEVKEIIRKLDLQVGEVEGHIGEAKKIHQETLLSTRELVESAELDVKEFRAEKDSIEERLDVVEDDIRARALTLRNIEISIESKLAEAEAIEEEFEGKKEYFENVIAGKEEALDNRVHEIESKISDLERGLLQKEEDLKGQVEGIDESKRKTAEEFDLWCKEMEAKEAEIKHDVDSIISRKRIELSTVQEECDRKRIDIEEELNSISSEVETKRKRKVRIEEEIDSLVNELKDLRSREEGRIETMRSQFEELSIEVSKKREINVVLVAEVHSLEKSQNKLEGECDLLRDKKVEHQIIIEQLTVDFDKQKYQFEHDQKTIEQNLAEKENSEKKRIKGEADSYKKRLFEDIESERVRAVTEIKQSREEADQYSQNTRKDAEVSAEGVRYKATLSYDEILGQAETIREEADAYYEKQRDKVSRERDREVASRAKETEEFEQLKERQKEELIAQEKQLEEMVSSERDVIEKFKEEANKKIESERLKIYRELDQEKIRSQADLEKKKLIWKDELDVQKKELVESLANEKAAFKETLEGERLEFLHSVDTEKSDLELEVKKLEDRMLAEKQRASEEFDSIQEELRQRSGDAEEQLSIMQQRFEQEAKDIEEKLVSERKEAAQTTKGLHDKLDREMLERKRKEDKDFAEKKLADMEGLREELKSQKEKASRYRNIEMESVTKNIQSALKSRIGSQFGGAKEEGGMMEAVEEVVTAVMGDDPDLKRNLVVKIDKKVKERERRFWMRLGFQVAGVLVALSVFIALPKGFISAVGASIWATISSDESAAEIFANKILDAQANRPKYIPKKDSKFKDSYSDNVLFTEGYFVNKMDVGYQEAWTIALNSFVPDELKLDEEIVPKIFSIESVLMGQLAERYDKINPEFVENGISRMREKEEIAVKNLKELFVKKANYKKFKNYEKSFFIQYFSKKRSSE